jgi:hypothetical protein
MGDLKVIREMCLGVAVLCLPLAAIFGYTWLNVTAIASRVITRDPIDCIYLQNPQECQFRCGCGWCDSSDNSDGNCRPIHRNYCLGEFNSTLPEKCQQAYDAHGGFKYLLGSVTLITLIPGIICCVVATCVCNFDPESTDKSSRSVKNV